MGNTNSSTADAKGENATQRHTITDADLDALTFKELERLRHRVISAQNHKSPLLHLPAELRNRIWRLACTEELKRQLKLTKPRTVTAVNTGVRPENPPPAVRPPKFLNACRQIKQEVSSILYGEFMFWVEYLPKEAVLRQLQTKEIAALMRTQDVDGPALTLDREVSTDMTGLVKGLHDTELSRDEQRIGFVHVALDLGGAAVKWNVY